MSRQLNCQEFPKKMMSNLVWMLKKRVVFCICWRETSASVKIWITSLVLSAGELLGGKFLLTVLKLLPCFEVFFVKLLIFAFVTRKVNSSRTLVVYEHIPSLPTSMFTTVFFDTRLWKTKHPRKRFQNFRPEVLRVIDRSDRNSPITATSVTFRPSLRHASGLWLVDFDPICR